MNLRRQQLDHWPKLSWCANLADDTVKVLHGSRVEYADEWVFEGTWAGEFGRGDFDREAPVIIGTGIRLRDNIVSFVCSTSPVDRLFYVDRKKELLVSNSLACLLSVAKLRLDPAFPYSKALSRYIHSHRHQPKNLPTLDGDEIRVLIYDKLVCSHGAKEQPRIFTESNFTSFEEYERFLSARISAIRANLQDERRRFKVAPVATISKGYDSAASTVIAKPLGLRSVLTISRVGTFSQHDDSGQEVAEELGIPVKAVISSPSAYRDYDLVWAGQGQSDDFNMTLFDFPDDLTLLVVGTQGDTVWQKGLKPNFNDSHHFLDRDPSGCGLTEWRLHKGVFLFSVPCIGASRLDCLRQINDSPAMDPWRIGGDYDRPIPRRILEQQGARRGTFGIKKMATISCRRFYPNDPDQLNDLEAFLEQQGKRLPRKFGKLTELVHLFRHKFNDVARKRKFVKIARFVRLPDYDDLFFIWANNRLAKINYRVEPQ
jgi:hypothetical protein